MNLDQPLSDEELDELDKMLASPDWPESTLDLSALDGFLTALAIGPTTVVPSQWLPWIWDEDESHAFATQAEAMRFFQLVYRHMNGIVGCFMNEPEKFEPMFCGEEGNWVVEPWCEGFSSVVDRLPKDWAPLLESDEMARAWGPIVAGNAAQLPRAAKLRAMLGVDEKSLPNAITEGVRAIHAFWMPQRKLDSEALLQSRPLNVTSPLRTTSPKIGRNDPCPCGSGRKFKKCCGAPGGPYGRN